MRAVLYLGGKCSKCDLDDTVCLEFHHIDPKLKTYQIAKILHYNWNTIERELDKCELLCRNCHIEEYDKEYPGTFYNTNDHKHQKQSIEYLGGKCNECGYDGYALEFHHIIPEDKEHKISEMWSYSWENIKRELDKCIILCSNCHAKHHSAS